eukprot:4054278-Pleurochrysis_carterae.AAC.3
MGNTPHWYMLNAASVDTTSKRATEDASRRRMRSKPSLVRRASVLHRAAVAGVRAPARAR